MRSLQNIHKNKRFILANPAQGYATKHKTEQRQVYEQRREIVFNSGIEYYAQHRAAALLSPSASEPQIDWVRQTMRKLNPRGFLAAAWMLAHDDISRYLNLYSGPVQMVVGLDDTITPPEKCTCSLSNTVAPLPILNEQDMQVISMHLSHLTIT